MIHGEKSEVAEASKSVAKSLIGVVDKVKGLVEGGGRGEGGAAGSGPGGGSTAGIAPSLSASIETAKANQVFAKLQLELHQQMISQGKDGIPDEVLMESVQSCRVKIPGGEP